MALLGEPIRPEVAKQINLRQKKHGITAGRDSETYRYLNTKTAWILLQEMVELIFGYGGGRGALTEARGRKGERGREKLVVG